MPACAVVIFGASGDLTRRKLIPALAQLDADPRSGVHDGGKVVMVAVVDFRGRCGPAIAQLGERGAGSRHVVRLHEQIAVLFPQPAGQLADVQAAVERERRDFRTTLFYDPRDCQGIAQDCAAKHIPVVEFPFTTGNCDLLANSILQCFQDKRLQLYDDPLLLRDLRHLNIVEKKWGFKLEPPSDKFGHGDRGVALALAIVAGLEYILTPPIIEPVPERLIAV